MTQQHTLVAQTDHHPDETLIKMTESICLVTPLAPARPSGKSIEDFEGHSLYSRDLLRTLRRNWPVSVVANATEESSPPESGVYRVWKPGFRFPFNILKQVIRSRSKVVHIERLGPTVYGPYSTVPIVPIMVLALRLLGKKVIVSFSDVIDTRQINSAFLEAFESWLRVPRLVKAGLTYFYLLTSKFANVILTQTKNSKIILETEYSVNSEKIRLIPLRQPAARRTIPPDDAKKLLGLGHQKVLLFFGHVAPYKGLNALVEAQALVQNNRQDVTLVIAGGNHRRLHFDYLGQLQDLARKFGTRTKFTGFLPNELIPVAFSAADIVVYPCASIPGSSGSVSLTKQYGKPLVTTLAVAREEGVMHLVDGYVIAEPNPELIAKAVLELLGDIDLTGSLGKNLSRTSVPIDLVGNEIGGIYKRLLE